MKSITAGSGENIVDKCPVCRLPNDAEHRADCEIKKALDAEQKPCCETCEHHETFRVDVACCGWAEFVCEASLNRRSEQDDYNPPCSLYLFRIKAKNRDEIPPKRGGRGKKSTT